MTNNIFKFFFFQTFFNQMDKAMMSNYEKAANEILDQLEPSERKHLSQTLDHLKERWEVSDTQFNV